MAAIIFLLSFWVYILIFVFRWPPPLSDHFPLHYRWSHERRLTVLTSNWRFRLQVRSRPPLRAHPCSETSSPLKSFNSFHSVQTDSIEIVIYPPTITFMQWGYWFSFLKQNWDLNILIPDVARCGARKQMNTDFTFESDFACVSVLDWYLNWCQKGKYIRWLFHI